MQIEINKIYINKLGEVVNIVSEDIPFKGRSVFIDNVGRSYFGNGQYYYGDCKYSIVSEIHPIFNDFNAPPKYTIEQHGPQGQFALYFGRNSARHGNRLCNINDSTMDLKIIEDALNEKLERDSKND